MSCFLKDEWTILCMKYCKVFKTWSLLTFFDSVYLYCTKEIKICCERKTGKMSRRQTLFLSKSVGKINERTRTLTLLTNPPEILNQELFHELSLMLSYSFLNAITSVKSTQKLISKNKNRVSIRRFIFGYTAHTSENLNYAMKIWTSTKFWHTFAHIAENFAFQTFERDERWGMRNG